MAASRTPPFQEAAKPAPAQALARRDQALFIKRFIEGYSLAELTTRWTSEAAVRKRLATIVQRLQRMYKDGG